MAPSAFAGAAVAITPGAGAAMDAAAGIIPQAVPFTFGGTPANDAVIGSRTIPFGAQTPYGPATGGAIKQAGLFSKPVAAAMGKALLRLAVPITIGMALYDAMQAAGMQVDAAGNVVVSEPLLSCGGWSYVRCISAKDAGANSFTCPAGWNLLTGFAGGVVSPYTGYGMGCGDPGGAALPSSPATDPQKDGAIDGYANSGGDKAGRLMQDAQAAGIPTPDTPYDPSYAFPSQPAASPWKQTGTSTDAAGNVTTTEKQIVITPNPAGQNVGQPIPVTVTENTRTSVNGVPTGTSSTTLADTGAGTTPSQTLQPTNVNVDLTPVVNAVNGTTAEVVKSNTLLGDIKNALGFGQAVNSAAPDAQLSTLSADYTGALTSFATTTQTQETADENLLANSFLINLPTGACAPFAGSIGGAGFSVDTCRYTEMLRSLIGWLFAVFGAFTVWETLFKRQS